MLFVFGPILIMILNISFHKAGGIKGVWLKMPEVVRAGSTVTLVCQFDMEGAPLYSVKWYRGNYEFYRYMPRERPPANSFPIAGLDVDLSGSNAHQVTLRAVPRYLSGPFTCEVSADAPYFSTAHSTANLSIIEMGIRRPIINVPTSIHRSNVQLIVNCSALPTNPRPQLTFYIDDVRVGSEYVQDLGPGFASLEVPSPQWSGTGPRWVRCEASVPGIYHLSSNGVAIVYQEVHDELDDEKLSASQGDKRCEYLFICVAVLLNLLLQREIDLALV